MLLKYFLNLFQSKREYRKTLNIILNYFYFFFENTKLYFNILINLKINYSLSLSNTFIILGLIRYSLILSIYFNIINTKFIFFHNFVKNNWTNERKVFKPA